MPPPPGGRRPEWFSCCRSTTCAYAVRVGQVARRGRGRLRPMLVSGEAAKFRRHTEVTAVQDHPYAAYTAQAEDYDVGCAELDEVLPPFTAGLLVAASRLLATLAYRDALDYGDRPFKRRSAKARHRVLARLPTDCDGQDRAFRLRFARGFDDLASDIEAGRAPLPRCTGERHALALT